MTCFFVVARFSTTRRRDTPTVLLRRWECFCFQWNSTRGDTRISRSRCFTHTHWPAVVFTPRRACPLSALSAHRHSEKKNAQSKNQVAVSRKRRRGSGRGRHKKLGPKGTRAHTLSALPHPPALSVGAAPHGSTRANSARHPLPAPVPAAVTPATRRPVPAGATPSRPGGGGTGGSHTSPGRTGAAVANHRATRSRGSNRDDPRPLASDDALAASKRAKASRVREACAVEADASLTPPVLVVLWAVAAPATVVVACAVDRSPRTPTPEPKATASEPKGVAAALACGVVGADARAAVVPPPGGPPFNAVAAAPSLAVVEVVRPAAGGGAGGGGRRWCGSSGRRIR